MPPVKRPRDTVEYFSDGRFSVTNRHLKTPRKTYRIATIEKLALRRDPFYFALALALPLLGFFFSFNGYLYNHERIILLGLAGGGIYLTRNLGMLFVESKALTGDIAGIATVATLNEVRDAVEDSLADYYERVETADDY